MNNLTLQIDPLDDHEGWRAEWYLGEKVIGQPIPIDGDAARALLDENRRLSELFEQRRRPLTEPGYLYALGRMMFEHWFQPVWETVAAQLGTGPRSLLIRSNVAAGPRTGRNVAAGPRTGRSPDREILNLPWELVELVPDLPLGCDPNWTLRRTPLARLQPNGERLTPGPLRILFLAAAPTDQDHLDYEREEDAILTATGRVKQTVYLDFADTGGLAELAELVPDFRPHVVHLSGHGVLTDDGTGTFAFEREDGRTDSVDARRIAADVFRGSSVRCVFLNGCQTARAAVAGLCQHLVTAGVPLVLGWAASVADDLATEFAEVFYSRLVRGESASSAAAHARQAIKKSGLIQADGGAIAMQDATFALPQLYTSVPGDDVFDRKAPPEPYAGPRTTRFILGDGIKGLTEGYVGRRREGQKLIPALRDGRTTVAVLTGIGGAGKSTLATRAANRLVADGFRLLPVRVEEGDDPGKQGQMAVTKLIEAFARAFLAAGRDDLHATIINGKIPRDQRLALAVEELNELRCLLVLDNFEEALHVETRTVVDPELAGFYKFLTSHLTRGSRAIVTCRYLPADTLTEQSTVVHLPLPDFQEHEVLKFLRREPRVDERLRLRVLPLTLVADLHRKFGGTPRFLEDVRLLLKTADPAELRKDLDGVEPGELSKARQKYYDQIITARLYEALSPEARLVTTRVAVSELPLPVDAVTRLTELAEEQAAASLESAVEYGLLQRFEAPDLPTLFHPPGLLRYWLVDPARLSTDDGRAVHRQLAAFWRDSLENERGAELRVPIELELYVCRAHALLGVDDETFCWASVRLAVGLTRRAEWRRARQLLDEVPEPARDGAWWHALATLDMNEGKYPAAREKFEKALAIIDQAIGDRAGEAATWAQLGMIDLKEGSYTAARDKYEKALDMFQAIGDRAGEAATWHNLASIDLNESKYPAAREKCEKARDMRQAIGDRAGEAKTWHQLATLDGNEGNYPAAREKFEKALTIKQSIGDRAGEAATWHQLATLDLNEGNYPAARKKYEESLTIKQEIGDRAGEAVTWAQLGMIDVNEGSYPAAREKYEKALAMLQAIGDRAGEAATLAQLGKIDLNEGSYPAAREKYEKALAMLQAIGDRAGEAKTWHQLATLDGNEGNYPAAREKFEKALTIKQSIGDRAGEAATLYQLGVLANEMGRGELGAQLIAISWMIRRAIGHGDAENAFKNLTVLCNNLGYDQARIGRMLDEAAQAYNKDRGHSLLKRAFADPDASAPDGSNPA
ncbi:MAG: tetratricopeptide repeat protein [Phycisphaerae bacterium]|nr:tetratricopeptide repeat protein [Phycisphaerae bacterium]